MEAASFTAWQLLVAKGYKKGFKHYIKGLGLNKSKAKNVSKEEKEQAAAQVADLFKKLGAGEKRAK